MAFQVSKSHRHHKARKPKKAVVIKKSLSKIILRTALIGILILVGLGFYTYFYYSKNIATPEKLTNYNNTGVILLDKDGNPFYTAYEAKKTKEVGSDQIAEQTKQALVAAEDKTFYENSGFSIKSILGAFAANILKQDRSYGGSTITQQLVKNSLLTTKKSYIRKYQELILAIAVNQKYSKDEILTMYINSVYFGEGSFGIESAANTYFNKPAKDLSLAESSMLIGILPAPSAYSPITGDPGKAKQRQKYVLERMVEDGFITQKDMDEALAQQLSYNTAREKAQKAPHFAEMVLKELREKYSEQEIARSGYQVQTTLDGSWQDQAEEIISSQVASLSYANVSNAAMVAIEPGTGKVRVVVGSADWNNEKFGKVNMANTKRQPGSSFKPIYYAKALEQGVVTPATILHDTPTTFGNYSPKNYDKSYRGDISVRRSLANSLNIPSVELLEKFGINSAIQGAKQLGIKSLDENGQYGLSLALGTAEVTLWDMTNAYATFAAQGQYNEPTTIETITDKYDKVIYKYSPAPTSRISPQAAFLISSILSDNSARSMLFGSSLNINRTAAVKTGTTENYRDAWTIGYTPELAVGVWVGNNDATEIKKLGGSTAAAPIWKKAIQTFLNGRPKSEFTVPAGVERISICYGTEKKAVGDGNAFMEYFLASTVPTATCSTQKDPEPVTATTTTSTVPGPTTTTVDIPPTPIQTNP